VRKKPTRKRTSDWRARTLFGPDRNIGSTFFGVSKWNTTVTHCTFCYGASFTPFQFPVSKVIVQYTTL
jgi:hypothetical protein